LDGCCDKGRQMDSRHFWLIGVGWCSFIKKKSFQACGPG
jgi:hypothetical protein